MQIARRDPPELHHDRDRRDGQREDDADPSAAGFRHSRGVRLHRYHAAPEGGRGERGREGGPRAGRGDGEIGRLLRALRGRHLPSDEDQVSDRRDDGAGGDDRRDTVGLLGGDSRRGSREIGADGRAGRGGAAGAKFAKA